MNNIAMNNGAMNAPTTSSFNSTAQDTKNSSSARSIRGHTVSPTISPDALVSRLTEGCAI